MIKDDIVYSKDIIKVVADREGLTEKQVENVLKFIIYRLTELTKDEDVTNISIPHLGNLYLKLGKVQDAIDGIEKFNPEGPKKENLLKNLYKLKDRVLRNTQSDKYWVTLHKTRSKISSTFFNGSDKLKDIEEKQNTKWI